MSEEHEYKVLREIIQIYRSQSCLWDPKSPDYRCAKKKNIAWSILLGKYKEIDSNADLSAIRRKIDNMKACYQRELRKVNKSLIESRSKDDIHEPTLWYFKLLSFLTKKELSMNSDHFMSSNQHTADNDPDHEEQQNDGVYMLIVDDNYVSPKRPVPKPTPEVLDEQLHEKQKQISHYTEELRRSIKNTPKGDQEVSKTQKINPFAVYVGKQLEDMSPFQRKVAEKVISEVIFLGKTDSLSLSSRVESTPQSISRNKKEEIKRITLTKRKILSDMRPVKITRFPITKTKRTHESQFFEVEDEESPMKLLPRSPNPLSSSDCSSESDCSEVHDITNKYDETSNSESDASNKYEDTSINDEDSILMTLLKTK